MCGYVCTCMCVCVCVCVCACVCAYVCTHAYKSVHACLHSRAQMPVCSCLCICVCVQVRVCVCACMHVHVQLKDTNPLPCFDLAGTATSDLPPVSTANWLGVPARAETGNQCPVTHSLPSQNLVIQCW